jgi:hypothetical protein
MKRLIGLLCLSTFISSSPSHAWSQHGLLTREALGVLKEVQRLEAVYIPLESIIHKMNLAYDKDKYGPAMLNTENAIPVQTSAD